MGKAVKAGGQALADGVFMRTERAWAIARDDGSVEVGEMPRNRFARVPVVRVLTGLAAAVALGVGRGMLGRGRSRHDGPDEAGGPGRSGGPGANRRFLAVMLGLQAVAIVAGLTLDPSRGSLARVALFNLGFWVVLLGGMRLGSPASLWRYHGAEHKAVAAHEAGVDLTDTDAVLRCPRVHSRCGTNLVFLLIALSLLPVPVAGWVQAPLFLLAFAVTVEIMSLAAMRPQSWASRALLAGGKMLQRHLTTVEPSRAEQEIGCRALLACLAEHSRLVGSEPDGAGEPTVAAAA